jgi:hypothetical protein
MHRHVGSAARVPRSRCYGQLSVLPLTTDRKDRDPVPMLEVKIHSPDRKTPPLAELVAILILHELLRRIVDPVASDSALWIDGKPRGIRAGERLFFRIVLVAIQELAELYRQDPRAEGFGQKHQIIPLEDFFQPS